MIISRIFAPALAIAAVISSGELDLQIYEACHDQDKAYVVECETNFLRVIVLDLEDRIARLEAKEKTKQ